MYIRRSLQIKHQSVLDATVVLWPFREAWSWWLVWLILQSDDSLPVCWVLAHAALPLHPKFVCSCSRKAPHSSEQSFGISRSASFRSWPIKQAYLRAAHYFNNILRLRAALILFYSAIKDDAFAWNQLVPKKLELDPIAANLRGIVCLLKSKKFPLNNLSSLHPTSLLTLKDTLIRQLNVNEIEPLNSRRNCQDDCISSFAMNHFNFRNSNIGTVVDCLPLTCRPIRSWSALSSFARILSCCGQNEQSYEQEPEKTMYSCRPSKPI